MRVPIVFFLAALLTAGIATDDTNSPALATAKAAARLDLSVAGYKELSAMARRSDMVNFTINFIDSDYILLTYNPKKMIRRRPECPLNAAGGIGPNLPQSNPFMDDAMDHGIMNRIAADTGGRAFYNANGIEQAMTVAMEQEENYYALSYTPLNNKCDGKFRRIKVSLVSDDKKYHVIHRSGYFAVDPNAPSSLSRDATTGFGLAAMQHDAPQSRQLVFEARVVPIGKPILEMDPRAAHSAPAKKKKKRPDAPPTPIEMQRYQIDYAITPSQLRFDPTSDGLEHGAMNFMVASFDQDGTVRTSIGSHVNGDLKPDSYQDMMTGGFRLHQEVDVPLAAAALRLGVQDAISGRLGTMEIPLPVKAPPGVEQSHSLRLPEIEPD